MTSIRHQVPSNTLTKQQTSELTCLKIVRSIRKLTCVFTHCFLSLSSAQRISVLSFLSHTEQLW